VGEQARPLVRRAPLCALLRSVPHLHCPCRKIKTKKRIAEVKAKAGI